ncbi:MAG TPA: serine/threonine-protein kinase [Streptosporangiaceae bacterium]|nr:serine/threonine-protein kinase [Streptosporangiaceae bacterium]
MAAYAGMVVGDRYQLDRPLGAGAMGEVWAARDKTAGRSVAVKLLSLSSAGREAQRRHERFKRECGITAKLSHPGIPVVHDFGTCEQTGMPYLVMQLIDGPTLTAFLKNHSPLATPAAAAICAQVCSALAAAHDAGLVHRDLKPDNIMLSPQGTVFILDFGVAAVEEPGAARLTATGMVVGTAAYMAPEQAEAGPVTHQTDLYALGCVAYELLASQPVFSASTQNAMMRCHIEQAAPSLGRIRGGIPPELDGLIASLLQKDPQNRPADARAAYRGFRSHLPGMGESWGGSVMTPDPTLPFREPCAPPLPARVAASTTDATRRDRRPRPSRRALQDARSRAAELAAIGEWREAITLLDQAIAPAETAFGKRDKQVVEARAARADILLEAAEYQNARDAYNQLRPDAVYSHGTGDSLVAHIDAGIADCDEWP